VPAADSAPNPCTLEDGRLDEFAARHGMTIRDVRRVMGPQMFARRQLEVEPHPAVVPGNGPGASLPPQPGALVPEDSAGLNDGWLDELAASLGVTIGDVRRMVELAPRRRMVDLTPRGTPRLRLDLHEICRRYEAGESLAAIGAVIGVSRTVVRGAMIRAGIPPAPWSDSAARRGRDPSAL
jgi:hypothetical protein